MPDRLEREIDEILSKMESRPSVGERIRAMNQRPPRRPRSFGQLRGGEPGLVLGFVLAAVAATLKWIVQSPTGIMDWAIGGLAVASFVIIAVSLIWQWRPGTSRMRVVWRGQDLGDSGGGETRRSPFASLLTRWQLIKLRMSYRRRH